MSDIGLDQARAKMAAASVHPIAIHVFERLYRLLEQDSDGFIHEADIDPLTDVTTLGDLRSVDSEASELMDGPADPTNISVVSARAHTPALAKTALVKLNGGLGTSMGMTQAKSLLPVHQGLSFLDIIAGQVRWARKRYDVQLPIVFMNSFRTEQDTLDALAKYPDLAVDGIALSMLQNQEPKLRADDLTPVSWPADPELEWCPPGHGDVYTVLQTSGTLEALRAAGIEYLNISNADNLGASPSPEIAQWFADSGASFAAEVVERTEADRKGGAQVVRDGQIILRETAQIAPEDEAAAADISKHRFFNANNLWIRIEALRELIAKNDGVVALPLIKNHKTVDPSDKMSTPVVQIECAMGAAIELFPDAVALHIDRSRFLPVKTTNDLLLMRSDIYALTHSFNLVAQATEPLITLDPKHYAFIADFDERFPQGPPSLLGARSLTVTGDWIFGADTTARGEAVLRRGRHDATDGQSQVIAAGAIITNEGIVNVDHA